MRRTLFFVLIALPLTAMAKKPNSEPQVWLNGDSLTTQVCWYQEKRYSEGAVIEMQGQLRVCANKEPNQSNGSLMWLPMDEEGRAVYPRQNKKIRVN